MQWSLVLVSHALGQGWGTCGTRKHFAWSESEFSLLKLEYNIASKQSTMMVQVKSIHSSSQLNKGRILGQN